MVRGHDDGLGLRRLRVALLVVVVLGVSAILGLLELWPPEPDPAPLTVMLYVLVGLGDLATGSPPMPSGRTPQLICLAALAALVLVALAALIRIEVSRRRRIAILPRAGGPRA